MPILKEENYTRIPSCQPGYALVLTSSGLKKISDVSSGDRVWSGTAFVKVKAKRSAGTKSVYKYRTTAGTLYCSPEHKVMSEGQPTSASSATSFDLCVGPEVGSTSKFDPQAMMDGLVLLHGNSDDSGIHLLVQHNDDRLLSEPGMGGFFDGAPFMQNPDHYYVKSTLKEEDLGEVQERMIPESYLLTSENKLLSFLRGLFSANGSVTGLHHGSPRVSLKLTSLSILENTQVLLSSLGMASYATFNPAKKVSFSNGTYMTTPSWDLNIGSSPARKLFESSIGFIQQHKDKRLSEANTNLTNKGPKVSYDLVDKTSVGKESCFDLILEGANTYWSGGVLVCDGSV
jgi:hypothetical protein